MPGPTNVQLAIEAAFKRALVTCTSPWVLDYATNLPGAQITFHTLLVILSAVMCILACFISLLLIAAHLLHWTRPREQRQMVRIIAFVPRYSIIALFCVWFYHASGFLIPFGQWTEGLALTCLFLFYVEAASPQETQRLQFFDELERKGLYAMAFQLFFTRIAVVIATEALYGLTCPLSSARRTGHTVIVVVQAIGTSIAVWACILIEKRLRSDLHPTRARRKLFSFKAVALLDAVQSTIFPILAEYQVFKPTPPYRVSWNDFAYAIPSFIFTVELLCVAIAFIGSFGYASYRRQAVEERGESIAGPGSALLQVLDLRDVWEGVAFAFWGRVPRSWRQPPHDEPKLADLGQHIDAELAPVKQLDIELGGAHVDGARA
ncbi:hypothetical protein LTR95_006381 [Oleoguttula sp. CCFEE 5521]